MGLTNTVVLWGEVLENNALVLPIRGAFRWIARVETVPATIHAVHIVVRVFAGALRPNGRPRTVVEFLAKGCPRLLSVSCSFSRCFALKPPNHGERSTSREEEHAVEVVTCGIPSRASGLLNGIEF